MNDDLPEQELKKVLDTIDGTLKDGPWNESNFLRLVSKSLVKVRDNLAACLTDSAEPQGHVVSQLANRVAARTGQVEIFIALYSTDGFNMYTWERILQNLPGQLVSRPIYSVEDDVKEMIRSKPNKINEAYVSAYVNQSDVLTLTPEKTLYDKLGKPLVSLKDRALSVDNIHRFIHLSGVYNYDRGRLVKEAMQKV